MRLQPELEGYSICHEVVVLGEGHVHNVIEDVGLWFTFPVRYVRDEDHEELLQDPVLAPFAAIADVDDRWRPDVLLRAARMAVADGRPELLQATRDLAHIRLESSTIDQVWKELPMPIPTSEQYRYEEGLAEGEARGLAEGEARGLNTAIAGALQDKFGEDSRIPAIAETPGNQRHRVVQAGDGRRLARRPLV